MSRLVRDWKIDPGWIIAINDGRVKLNPECPMYQLEYPFRIGAEVTLGGMGFGYEREEGSEGLKDRWKVAKPLVKPHKWGLIIKGGASIHNKVNIDGGDWRHTIIGPNARINTNVFVGHNVQMGRDCLINVGASISGSTNIGDGVILWKNASVAQRCNLKDGAIIGQDAKVLEGTTVGENEVWFNKEEAHATFQRMRRKDE